jgi:hypothetical protein
MSRRGETENLFFNRPPCARYEGGENDARLNNVWHFVAGLAFGKSEAIGRDLRVARLYDFKGFLIVGTRYSLTPYYEHLFRIAWSEAGEVFDHVEFLDVHSERWKVLWGRRRFESDWQSS